MRIALVHSYYSSRQPSGENEVVDAQAAALRGAGHSVLVAAARTDNLERRPAYQVRASARVASKRGDSPLRQLASFHPDVIHVHNLFPNFGESWVSRVSAPIVITLHNFRPICVNGLLLRDGRPCTICLDGRWTPGVRYGCYRGSALASAPIAWANRKGVRGHPAISRATRVIVLSRLAHEIYRRAGIPEEKLVIWPNFLRADSEPTAGDAERKGWLFVGRLSPEKGILRLVERWPAERPLSIVGDGPQLAEVRVAAEGKAVKVLGALPRKTVLSLMAESTGLAFPSVCFESFAMVYVEAMAAGLPVLAWKPNSAHDMVIRDGTGIATTWQEDLPRVLDEAEASFPSMRARCVEAFESELSETSFLTRAEALYREVVSA